MEIETLIKKMKDINSALINFIEADDGHDAEFTKLIEIIKKHEILGNKGEVQLLFQLLSKLADNHHRTSDIFDKFETIFQYLIKDSPSPVSYYIPDYTKYNKRLLFFLLEKRFIKPDDTFLNQYLQSQKNPYMLKTYYYLYPKIKEFIEVNQQKKIEEEILQKYSESISSFEEKCQIGENDSYICSLIRSDSVEEFISYVSRTNLSLSTKIKPSIYETNSFLIDKEPTLIEYATFYGSIQIVQYLKNYKVPLKSSLWLYAVHSNNAELIHFLEENGIKPKKIENSIEPMIFGSKTRDKSYDDVLIESIKCHHNDISNYIIDNICNQNQVNDQNQFISSFNATIVESLNFFFFPNEIFSLICHPGKGFKLSQLCFFLTTVTIPSSVTKIGNSAFSGCSKITQITIPSSVTEIGNSSFFGCSLLEQITIPSSVTSIGNSSFSGCSVLEQITIPSSVKSFGNNVFNGVKTLEITGNIDHIPRNLFYKCSSLTKITIPSSVTKIESSAFSGCSSLEQIIIPSSVTEIGDFAFYKCPSLAQISIPSSVKSFGYRVFKGIEKLIITGDINRIPRKLFSECSSLTQITIPSSVTKIESSAFENCSSLAQITIPSSVTEIGDYAFYECSSLVRITIPSSVTEIGDYAFGECSSLRQITILSLVTKIGSYAFFGCSSIAEIIIPSSVTNIGIHALDDCPSSAIKRE